jgi:hypothetical protein
MEALVVPLLDQGGQWTFRDRHQHHQFALDVPDRTAELRIHFRWGPLDLGSEHAQNQLALSLWGPDGFRGAALRQRADQEMTIGESIASPGFHAGRIPPGPWSINIDSWEILNNGAESGYLTYRVVVTAVISDSIDTGTADTTRLATPLGRGGVSDGPRWYQGDLHTHTDHSDGIITVEDRVRGAVERGLEFLAITDHNTTSHMGGMDGWPDVITPIRGSEVTTFHGHINCLGLSEAIDWRDDAQGGGAAGIVEEAHRQNAIVSINHPDAFGDPWCSGCHWDFARVDFSTFDAIEVWNGRWKEAETDNNGALAFWTDLLDAGLRPTAIAGTDSHSAEEDRYQALPLTHVHAEDRGEASILDGIRRGRAFLSSGPIVSFRAKGSDGIEAVMPGGELPADGWFNLNVDIAGVDAPATLWSVTSGSMVPLGLCEPGTTHLVREGLHAQRWWRLELRNGSVANGDLLVLTNPLFVPA